jgi:hypothetical protein
MDKSGVITDLEKKLAQPKHSKGLKGVSRPKFESFESLFYNPLYPDRLIEFLKENDILDKEGHWIGTTTNATEFIALIVVLKLPDFRIIRFSSYREVGRLFAAKFNINISDRAMTLHTNAKEDQLVTYQKLISEFLKANLS